MAFFSLDKIKHKPVRAGENEVEKNHIVAYYTL